MLKWGWKMKHQKPLSKRFWDDDLEIPFYKRWARRLERLFLKKEIKQEFFDVPMTWIDETATFSSEDLLKLQLKENYDRECLGKWESDKLPEGMPEMKLDLPTQYIRKGNKIKIIKEN